MGTHCAFDSTCVLAASLGPGWATLSPRPSSRAVDVLLACFALLFSLVAVRGDTHYRNLPGFGFMMELQHVSGPIVLLGLLSPLTPYGTSMTHFETVPHGAAFDSFSLRIAVDAPTGAYFGSVSAVHGGSRGAGRRYIRSASGLGITGSRCIPPEAPSGLFLDRKAHFQRALLLSANHDCPLFAHHRAQDGGADRIHSHRDASFEAGANKCLA